MKTRIMNIRSSLLLVAVVASFAALTSCTTGPHQNPPNAAGTKPDGKDGKEGPVTAETTGPHQGN